MFANQSLQEYEHAEKLNDLPHAKLLLGKYIAPSCHDIRGDKEVIPLW